MAAVDFTFNFKLTESKIAQAQQLIDMGVIDRMQARQELFGENPWLEQAKEVSSENYARVSADEEKVEPPPGKRKIIL